jgi:ATP-binding cassette, subfamily B, bacterial MsbA
MTTSSAYQRARSQWAKIWPYFSASRGAWLLAGLAAAVAAATEPMIPALLKPLLDRGFQGSSRVPMWHVPALLLLVFGLRAAAGFISQYALARIVNLGLQRIRDALFAKMLRAQLSLYEEQSASTLANTVVYEVQNGSSMLIGSLVRAVRDALTLLALVGYLLYLNWKLSLVVAVILPPLGVMVRSLTRRLYRLTQQTQVATDELAYVVEENVLAQRDIRLHAAQGLQVQRFARLSHKLRQLSLKTTVATAGMSAMVQILSALALSAVICIALLQGAGGDTTAGSFMAFITAMLLLIAPIKSLAEVGSPLTRGLAALERGQALIDEVADEQGGGHAARRAQGDIRLESVTVRYKDGAQAALERIDLHVRAGETLALVGSSGSGKTTLAQLLPRLLECSEGRVLLDGQDIAQWDLASLRAQFAYVSQHVVMLNDSLAVNVALGQEPDRERVRLCLQAARLEQLLQDLPQGMDTVLGHNAMQLSGGQRQRLAIARALYKDAPILILDEATSALDSQSEHEVQQAIERVCVGRTSLVIAHRLSTIEHADRIVVLDSGKVVETGSHQELLAQGGHYSHLYRLGFKQGSSPAQA